ncbi:hypothetical protein CPB84DRAFT_1794148 [Gymnopilus junonius]|uniref:Uncharacterized protein n=1 Tax=Gymnopilus junonius TaxID=109634 RepID=A0A9P5TGM6_GYMJU|nr:hypothetical protein CPB84DRAFT_1794148 [Gymnopilus junonius]
MSILAHKVSLAGPSEIVFLAKLDIPATASAYQHLVLSSIPRSCRVVICAQNHNRRFFWVWNFINNTAAYWFASDCLTEEVVMLFPYDDCILVTEWLQESFKRQWSLTYLHFPPIPFTFTQTLPPSFQPQSTSSESIIHSSPFYKLMKQILPTILLFQTGCRWSRVSSVCRTLHLLTGLNLLTSKAMKNVYS